MNTIRVGLLALLGAAATVTSTLWAETTVSPSTTPAASVDETVLAMFEFETRSLNSVRESQIEAIAVAATPDPVDIVGYSKSSLKQLPAVSGGKQWSCLTEALYFEARGESVLGQFAVAEVILNRVDSASYPDTICGVVRQGTGQRHKCQFSFYCDGRAEIMNDKRALEQVGKVADIMMAGADRSITQGATHYHTLAVSPKWSRVFPRTATIGYHHFYRQPLRISRR